MFFFSAWVYNRVLYMFGGVIPPFNVLTNDLYALDLNTGPPYQFVRVNANYTLSNFAYLEPRRACGMCIL